MKCQEVIELMQRDLDRDLGETESQKLNDHIRECEECTEMYERLQRVSNDLAHLPKVKPPYSIVDSIMPELHRIDHEMSTSSERETLDAEAESKPNGKGSKIRRFRNPFAVKMMGSVAAAVVLVAMVMSGNILDWMKPEFSTKLSTENSAGSVAESDRALNVPKTMMSEEGAPDQGMSFFSMDAVESYDQYGKRAVTEGENSDTSDGFSASDERMEIAGEPMSIAQMDQVEYPSPDGKYVASVKLNEEGRLQVIVSTQEGESVFKSAEMIGHSVGDVQWDEESKKLEYRVYSDTGAVSIVVELNEE